MRRCVLAGCFGVEAGLELLLEDRKALADEQLPLLLQLLLLHLGVPVADVI